MMELCASTGGWTSELFVEELAQLRGVNGEEGRKEARGACVSCEEIVAGEGGGNAPLMNAPQKYLSLLQLFLGPQLVCVPALFLAAVGRTLGKTGVAQAADLLVAVELLCQDNQGGLDHTADNARQHVQLPCLRDVALGHACSSIKLLALVHEARVAADALLELCAGAHLGHRARRLHVKREGRTRKVPNEDLHESHE